ncbi:MAG: Gfo/Idh/MocA family oxidoreductase [Chloroflexi bacterium]|nr:Gfo/Idh/MocA family oxidoreductase [Chloroflexota bacterium]
MTIRVAFVGASGHAHLVLDDLPRLPQVQIVACAPSFPEEDMSRILNVPGKAPAFYADWQHMLSVIQPDIVVACGRNDTHAPVAIKAAQLGCHIFAEKPAAHTIEEVNTLRRLVREHQLIYTLMLPIRYEPPYWTAHRLVREGAIGEPLQITAQKSYRWGAQRPTWYADRSTYGSTMTWVGIHAFDYARWVSGLDYTEVFAYHANLAHPERPGCQDVATVMASLSNGGSAVFNLDYLRPAAAPTHGDDRLRIAGSEGVLEVCDTGTRLQVTTASEHIPSWPLEHTERSLMTDLVRALEDGAQPLVSAEEAFAITEFAIRAAQAADEHRVIPL